MREQDRLRRIVRARRAELGLAQKDIAQRMGITPQYYNDFERGRRSISKDRIPALARAIELPQDFLYFYGGYWPPDIAALPYDLDRCGPLRLERALAAFRKELGLAL